jgi:hypothetical protein
MAIGRISGPMLFSNLERQGVDLAFESNLIYIDVTNHRVGVVNSSPQYSLDSSGNVKLANLIILGNTISSNTGRINLGSTSNVVITGGSANFVLYTDGAGNLQWGNVADLAPAFGNINSINASFTNLTTTNFSTGNAVISGGYISSLTNADITTGSITNFSTGNAVISGGYISSLANITTTTGNAGSWYSTQLNSTSGNIATLVTTNFSSPNVEITGGNVTANVTGNVTGTFANFSSNVYAEWFIGKVDSTVGTFTTSVTTANIIAANSYINSSRANIQNISIAGSAIRSTATDLTLSANLSNPNNIIRLDSVSAVNLPKGSTAQRPPAPEAGYIRFNTQLNTLEWWTGISWYYGQQSVSSQTITPDGLTATFTLSQSSTTDGILVNINGTLQQAGSGAYTVLGDQITFSEVPLATDIIEIRFLTSGTTLSAYDGGIIPNAVHITSTTTSTSVLTGALIVDGGTGIAGPLYIGNTGDVSANIGSIYSLLQTLNANVGAYEIYANANATTQATSINTIQANLGAYQTYANANVVAIQANLGAYQTYANANVVAIQANLGAFQVFSNSNAASQTTSINTINANIGAYQTYANANVVAIQANLGAFQVFSNSNAATQATSINTINANVGAYQTYANANVVAIQANLGSFQTYANTKIGTNSNSNLVVVSSTASTSNVTGALVVNGGVGISGALNVASTISDNKGNVRALPQNSQSGAAYTLISEDAGRHINYTSASGNIAVPGGSVFTDGDMITIFNNTATSITVSQNSGSVLRLAGTATTGNRVIAQYGLITLLCVVGGATPTFICAGAGIA